PPHWTDDGDAFDPWDLKAVLEELGIELGATASPGITEDAMALIGEPAWAVRSTTGESLGSGGRIADAVVDAPDWAAPVFGLELTLEPSIAEAVPVTFSPLPSFPSIERDLALVVARGIAAATVEGTIRTAAGALLDRIGVFDVYEGAGIAPDARSLAFRLRFGSPERTLTDEEVDTVVDRILERLRDEHDIRRR
ncbi:MAG: hypothetical protein ACRELX_17205, partial [Longimicrobiales bacterium]